MAPVVVAAIVLAATACGGGDDPPPLFRNPVYHENFRDPFVLRVDDVYYAYGTKDAAGVRSGIRRTVDPGNVQVLRSRDLVRWKKGKDAMPKVGAWAYPQRTWAPEVLDVGDGTYVLYYTGLSNQLGRQCVGRAVARSPGGPFVDRWSEPLVCQTDEGGSIDPSPFRDDDGRFTWRGRTTATAATSTRTSTRSGFRRTE